jgi:hypothetical protein
LLNKSYPIGIKCNWKEELNWGDVLCFELAAAKRKRISDSHVARCSTIVCKASVLA